MPKTEGCEPPTTKKQKIYLNTEAERAQKFLLPCQPDRVALGKIGWHPRNRGGQCVMPQHTHNVALNIVEKMTSSRRYGVIYLVEVPKAVRADWLQANREKARRNSLLPPVPDELMYANLRCTHFTQAHKLIQEGHRFYMDNPKSTPLKLHEEDTEGQMIQEKGVKAIVYSEDLWYDEAALLALLREDNANAEVTKPETELETHRKYRKVEEKATFRMETLRRLHKRQEEDERIAQEELDAAQHEYDQSIILQGEKEVERDVAFNRKQKAQMDKYATLQEIEKCKKKLNALRVKPTTSPQGCEPTGDQCEATGEPTTGSPVAPTTTGSTFLGRRSHSTGVDPVDQVEEYKKLFEEEVLRMELLFRKKKEQDEELSIAKEELRKAKDRNEELDIEWWVMADKAWIAEHKATVRVKEAQAATDATKEEIFDLTEKMSEFRAKLGS